jgi:hypothetical protein
MNLAGASSIDGENIDLAFPRRPAGIKKDLRDNQCPKQEAGYGVLYPGTLLLMVKDLPKHEESP